MMNATRCDPIDDTTWNCNNEMNEDERLNYSSNFICKVFPLEYNAKSACLKSTYKSFTKLL